MKKIQNCDQENIFLHTLINFALLYSISLSFLYFLSMKLMSRIRVLERDTSPILFNVYIEEILREWITHLPFYGIDLENQSVLTILFADDQVIIANSGDVAQKSLLELYKLATKYSLNISLDKIKVMAFKGASEI